jgi:GNAT superfamily N-acetyltransferase
VKIIEVSTRELAREFLMLPVTLYKNEKYWIRPLDNDIEFVFDKKKNKYFTHGECTRWILQNEENQTIGRVAAFIDRKTMNKDNDQPTGGMGFFECINDKKAAFLLFDTCKNWLSARGMEAMDGSINFGDRDKWWGVLVEGFEVEPNYCMPYNFPYYRELFESYGFKEYFQQFTFARKVMDKLSDKLAYKAELIAKDPNYTFCHLDPKKIDKFTEDFRVIYNQAWANHSGVAQMQPAQAKMIMKQIKPIMDERIMWFGYYKEEPIAFYLMLPEVNQIFKYVNGKLDWWGKLIFLYHQLRKTNRKMFGVAFGVVPEHQGKGVDGAIIMAVRQMVQDKYKRYDDFEMNWIGDFNPKMIRLVEQVGAYKSKVHITYRKLFDETKPFKRAKMKE